MKDVTTTNMNALRSLRADVAKLRDKWSDEECENEDAKRRIECDIKTLMTLQAEATTEAGYKETTDRLRSAQDKLNYCNQQKALYATTHKLNASEYKGYMTDLNEHRKAVIDAQREEIRKLYEDIAKKIDAYSEIMQEITDIENDIRRAADQKKTDRLKSYILELIPEKYARGSWQKDRFACFLVEYRQALLSYRGTKEGY